MEAIEADMMGFYHRIINETQLRWIGPEKGVSQMACGAILNAVWDLLSKMAGKPLWKYVADMEPEQLVECIDFKYVCGEDTEREVGGWEWGGMRCAHPVVVSVMAQYFKRDSGRLSVRMWCVCDSDCVLVYVSV